MRGGDQNPRIEPLAIQEILAIQLVGPATRTG